MESGKQAGKSIEAWRARQRGFTLIELAIATVVLLFGVVAVMQLVPAALVSNRNNRFDTTSMVVAQRELDQMISQPLSSASFTDADLRTISLGDSTQPNTIVGGPVLMVGLAPRVNFSGSAVPGYNYSYTDPNSPGSPPYEVRWAVITTVNNGKVTAKRFIVGVWRRDPTQPTLPVTIDAWVQK